MIRIPKERFKATTTPPPLDELQQETRGSNVRPKWNLQTTQASDGITPLTFCSKKEVKALKGVLHRRCPDENTPHTTLLLLVVRKESPSMRQRCPIKMKTPRQMRWLWSLIRLCNRPWQPLLLPRTHYQERSTPILRIGTAPDKLETRWTNQVGAGALPISTDSKALSQWLVCCDGLITMTDILRKPVSRTARARQPFSLSPFLSSTWWRRRETIATKQREETLKQDLLEKKIELISILKVLLYL